VANNKNNFLITGGAGFIGFSLAKSLIKKADNLYILDNLSRGRLDNEFKNFLKNKNVHFFKVNLQNKIDIRLLNLSHIFHLAGSVGVKNINQDAYGAFLNNVNTLKNVIDFSKSLKKSPKLIVFSTSEVYSNLIKKNLVKFPINEKNDILIENDIIDRDSYFLSKIFNEKLLQLSNLAYIILRPHNIYGPRMGQSHVIPELIRKMSLEKIKKIKKTIVFSPNHKRAFCYINDAIQQITKLSLNKKIKNQTFNIGNMQEEIKMLDLAQVIKKLVNKKSKIIRGPITKGSPKRRSPDMKKTVKYSKFKNFTSLNTGLIKTINWYLKNH
jgi:UDP-glucose 4-epimerase